MVYLKHWSDFHAQALELYKKHPDRTRYLVKTHPSRQWLVLKVTDDYTTLKYRSRSTVILNRFDSFSREIQTLMSGASPSSLQATTAGQEAPLAQSVASAVEGGAENIVGAAGGTTQRNAAVGSASGGGGSSKKKNKKKGGKK